MSRLASILVVDDDPRVVRFVRANLESVGYKVLVAAESESALDLVEREEPDLIVLDLMLPGIDGYELCQRIREFSSVPILMLTARGDEADKVKGLRLGADDYLAKPFGIQEFLARVEALLRRIRFAEEVKPQPLFLSGGLTIDFLRRTVKVREQEVVLTPTEYKLLSYMAQNVGKLLPHEDLLNKVWGREYQGELDYLRAYILRLRQKLEEDPHHPTLILSRPGMGYMLVQSLP